MKPGLKKAIEILKSWLESPKLSEEQREVLQAAIADIVFVLEGRKGK